MIDTIVRLCSEVRLDPAAIVLSCLGAPEGDLNLVRSLGEQGVRVIVLSEYAGAPAARSKYCAESRVVPRFTRDPDALLDALSRVGAQLGAQPVVFASADPDLSALIRIDAHLGAAARSTVIDPALTAALMDKHRFYALAAQHGLPVPLTYTALSEHDLDAIASSAVYPLMLKPSNPVAWHHDTVAPEYRSVKAVCVASSADFLRLTRNLGTQLDQTIVQEFVPGADEEHFDVHVYIARDGQVLVTFTGRKWRIAPPHAGSGCYVESVHVPDLERLAVSALQSLGYRGLANLNFKRHARTGEFKLLEINPRVSQWNILGTRCGVNLAWVAYRDACDLAVTAAPRSRAGVFYLNGRTDVSAFRTYRREGSWGWGRYLRSLVRRRLVLQYLQWRDLLPGIHVLAQRVSARLGRSR